MRELLAVVVLVGLVGCGAKDDLIDTSSVTTGATGGAGSGTGDDTPGTLADVGYAFIEVVWGLDSPSPAGIVHVQVFDATFDDPAAISGERVGIGSSPVDAGAVSGDNMATYLFENLPTDVTYGVLAFLDEDGTGGVDDPRPDSGDFVALEGASYPTLVFTVTEGKVVAEVNTAVP